jgi:hypothetical protein
MKTSRILALSLGLLVALVLPAHAGAGKKGAKGSKGGASVLARLDRNHDGSFDSAESERVIALYAALSALDTDHDGKLSESEVAAAKVPAGRKKKK